MINYPHKFPNTYGKTHQINAIIISFMPAHYFQSYKLLAVEDYRYFS